MKRIALLAILALGLTAAPAFAINDPLVPGENCAPANAQAVGHQALQHEQSAQVSAPFSQNNPGQSTGAKGQANSKAVEHCANA